MGTITESVTARRSNKALHRTDTAYIRLCFPFGCAGPCLPLSLVVRPHDKGLIWHVAGR